MEKRVIIIIIIKALLQVSNPRGVLDEAHAGALQTAASLFSLEAGGPESGFSLEAAVPMPFGHSGGRFSAPYNANPYRGGGRSVSVAVRTCPQSDLEHLSESSNKLAY